MIWSSKKHKSCCCTRGHYLSTLNVKNMGALISALKLYSTRYEAPLSAAFVSYAPHIKFKAICYECKAVVEDEEEFSSLSLQVVEAMAALLAQKDKNDRKD